MSYLPSAAFSKVDMRQRLRTAGLATKPYQKVNSKAVDLLFAYFRGGLGVPGLTIWARRLPPAQPSEKRIPFKVPTKRHSDCPLCPHTTERQSK